MNLTQELYVVDGERCYLDGFIVYNAQPLHGGVVGGLIRKCLLFKGKYEWEFQRFHLLITFTEAELDGKQKQVGGINNMLQMGEIKVHSCITVASSLLLYFPSFYSTGAVHVLTWPGWVVVTVLHLQQEGMKASGGASSSHLGVLCCFSFIVSSHVQAIRGQARKKTWSFVCGCWARSEFHWIHGSGDASDPNWVNGTHECLPAVVHTFLFVLLPLFPLQLIVYQNPLLSSALLCSPRHSTEMIQRSIHIVSDCSFSPLRTAVLPHCCHSVSHERSGSRS